MKTIRRTAQFKRDVERMQRQGKDWGELKAVLENLVRGERLAAKHRDHVLVGQYKGTRECHLESDWLLIYELAKDRGLAVLLGSRHHSRRKRSHVLESALEEKAQDCQSC